MTRTFKSKVLTKWIPIYAPSPTIIGKLINVHNVFDRCANELVIQGGLLAESGPAAVPGQIDFVSTCVKQMKKTQAEFERLLASVYVDDYAPDKSEIYHTMTLGVLKMNVTKRSFKAYYGVCRENIMQT